MSHRDEALEEALTTASDAHGLQPYYRDCVRPILNAPRARWPSCCGSGCEPCNDVLCAVAQQVLTALGRAPPNG